MSTVVKVPRAGLASLASAIRIRIAANAANGKWRHERPLQCVGGLLIKGVVKKGV